MFELAFVEQCADPGIEIATVERFISAVGTDNPLAITITDGNRLILPEAPRTPEAAMLLIERFVGEAVVRVGVTRYPAGHGISDVSDLSPDLVDACGNIRMGTTLFGKVYRIVAHSRGAANQAVLAEALDAWRTGTFEDRYVFGEPDPGPLSVADEESNPDTYKDEARIEAPQDRGPVEDAGVADPNEAGIRVDISGIGDHAP